MGRVSTNRGRFAVASLMTAVLVSACSGSAATAVPSTPPSLPVSAAPASIAPSHAAATIAAASAAATPAPATPAADPVLAGATNALGALKSYQFKTTMSGGSYGSVLGDGMAGTVVNGPTPAVEFTYVDLEVIQSGGNIWQKNGSSWDLSNERYPGAKTTFDSFGPPVLLAHDFTSFVSYYSLVGDETVGGVATSHYTCNPKALGYFSGVYGFAGTATVSADVWIAKSGGYPAQFEIKASGAATFDLKFVVTKANDAGNVVKVPAK